MAELKTSVIPDAIMPSGISTPSKGAGARPGKFKNWRLVKKNWQLYLFVLPAFILFALFSYWPMYGILIAFKSYNPALGIWGSPWTHPLFHYFQLFFSSAWFGIILKNTIVLSLYNFVVGNIMPLLLALMINLLRKKALKRTVQTVTYLPYFVSVVVVVSILNQMFSDTGVINHIVNLFGGHTYQFLTSDAAFKHLYNWSGIWSGMGYGSIIYFAALSNVSPELHEAAIIDGASRLQRVYHIDLPSVIPAFVIMMIMGAGQIMNVSYEKVLLMQNDVNLAVSEVINTYVYKVGLLHVQYSLSAAVSLFNNIINLVFLLIVNKISAKVGETSLW